MDLSDSLSKFSGWLSFDGQYSTLVSCMSGDLPWIAQYIILSASVFVLYVIYAMVLLDSYLRICVELGIKWYAPKSFTPFALEVFSKCGVFILGSLASHAFIVVSTFYPYYRLAIILMYFLLFISMFLILSTIRRDIIFRNLKRELDLNRVAIEVKAALIDLKSNLEESSVDKVGTDIDNILDDIDFTLDKAKNKG